MDAPKNRFVKVHLNNFSFESENRNAAGTAQDTVGHPGIQIPIIANNTNKDPNPMYIRLLIGLLTTAYFSTTASTVSNRSLMAVTKTSPL